MASHLCDVFVPLRALSARRRERPSRVKRPAAQAPPTTPPAIVQLREQPRISLKGMTCDQLADWCESIGERRARGMHIWRCAICFLTNCVQR